MSYGYSQSLARANKSASIKSLGVALGRVCIDRGISVSDVAGYFGVSRMTIYNWFKGEASPTPAMHARIEKYIASLKKK